MQIQHVGANKNVTVPYEDTDTVEPTSTANTTGTSTCKRRRISAKRPSSIDSERKRGATIADEACPAVNQPDRIVTAADKTRAHGVEIADVTVVPPGLVSRPSPRMDALPLSAMEQLMLGLP